MSDLPADYADRLNLREQLARIDRAQAETRKFAAEQAKLSAEAAKLHRDRFFAPVLALVATLGAIAALSPTVLRAWGVH